jgi:hypothetical protein
MSKLLVAILSSQSELLVAQALGNEFIVEGFQSRDGSFRANGRDIVFADGRRPFSGTFGTGSP